MTASEETSLLFTEILICRFTEFSTSAKMKKNENFGWKAKRLFAQQIFWINCLPGTNTAKHTFDIIHILLMHYWDTAL